MNNCRNCKWYGRDAKFAAEPGTPTQGSCYAVPPVACRSGDEIHEPYNWMRPRVYDYHYCSLFEKEEDDE